MSAHTDIFMWISGIITGFMVGVLWVVNALPDHPKDPMNAPEPVLTCPAAEIAEQETVQAGRDRITDNNDAGSSHD